MNKLAGSILIIGASTLGGCFLAERFAIRCRMLKTWLRILEILQTEIYYQARLLPEVFGKAASMMEEQVVADSLVRLASRVEYGSEMGTAEAWRQFVMETGPGSLSKSDNAILTDLGGYLGSTDRDDQIAKIKASRERLEYNLENAEDERKKRTGLYRYLGFAAGAVLVLWLL
jgi:stage III sporulation protein AB